MSDEMRRGTTISYAEFDGIPVCIVDGAWCEREAGHDGPHAFRNVGPWIETSAWQSSVTPVVSPVRGE